MSDTWDGRPENPERSGWHWVKRRSPHQVAVPYCWNPHAQVWTNCPSTCSIRPSEMTAPDRWSAGADYLGPCIEPAETAAREQAARDKALREAAAEVDCGCKHRSQVLARLDDIGLRAACERCPRYRECCALQARDILALIDGEAAPNAEG